MPLPKFHPNRAQRAERALDAYQKAAGEAAVHDSERIRDLLQDLIHWLAQHDYTEPRETFREAAESAYYDLPIKLKEGPAE